LPPAFAARLRAVLLPLEDDLLVPVPDFRALDVERRLEELELRLRVPDPLDEDELVLRLRPPPDPLAVDLRAPPDELDDLRAPEALDLRELEAREPDDDEDELDLRALDPRALDPDDLRAPDPLPDDFFRDDPPPLPELDSAIAVPPLKLAHRHPLGAGGTI
jgi:hypothetical protein